MHDCTYCGCACYCHGDIDDCQVETPEYADAHCTGCGCPEEDWFDADEPFEDDAAEDGKTPNVRGMPPAGSA